MAVERIIGVDFGTSTSVIRVKRYENGTYVGEKLETKDVVFNNTPITPTLVQINKDDPSKKPYFGYEAQQYRKDYNDFHSFKMDLESADPEAKARARELTKSFYGYLAQEYKNQSDGGHLGDHGDKKRTLISYPVKWSEETKAFMLETARNAGFPNVTGMDEAQAAIQAVTVMSADHLKKHGLLTAGQSATILLIDMGAGTTDLVLARYTPGEKPKTEVLNTWPRGGDLHFGGREIDDLLPGYFRELLLEELPPKTVDKLLRIPADQYKSWKELTVSPDLANGVSVRTFSALDQRLSFVDMELDFTLDREAFETCLSSYLPQFPALVKGCLEDAGVPGSDVDLVIVTGGHSQWYFVNDMLTGKLTRFGEMGLTKIQQNPARIVPISRPQETVALGLAYSGLPVEFVKPTPVPPSPGPDPEPPVPSRDDFRLKLDPNSSPLFFNGAAVVFGTVESGSVNVGNTVWVHGGPADGKYVQVKNIACHNENVPSAKTGDEIAIQLLGISYKEAEAITHITGKAANPVDPPEPPVTGSFRLKLVPENKAFPAGGGTMVVGTVLEGSVKVGDHVYVCGGPGQAQKVQVQKIVNRRDGTTITSAGVEAFVTVQLSGISVANAACATYLADKADGPVPPPPGPDSDGEDFMMVIHPRGLFNAENGSSMALGTVMQGRIMTGDWVYICGNPGQPQERMQVCSVYNRAMEPISSAKKGTIVRVKFFGHVQDAVRKSAFIAARRPDYRPVPQPQTQLSLSQQRFVFKLSLSKHSTHYPEAKMVWATGRLQDGSIRPSDTVYVCSTTGTALEAQVVDIESVGILMDMHSNEANRLYQSYNILLSGVTGSDLQNASCLRAIPENVTPPPLKPVKPEPVTPTPSPQPVTPTPGGGGFKPLIQIIGDKIAENQKAKLENTLRWMESVEQDAHTIPHAPESEFEIGSAPGNNCTIRKYKGSSPIVSIPPVILGHRVVAIEKYAFSGPLATQANKAIEAVIIPASICEIGNSAFANCINLKLVIAHKMVHTIGDAAFSGCNSLLRMDFGMGPCEVGQVHLPPALKTVGSQAFAKVLSFSIECIFKVVTISKMTKVKNPIGGKTFDPKYCAVFYY